MSNTSSVLQAVYVERRSQDQQWGQQDHDHGTWAMILGEEFGEACQATLSIRFADDKPLDKSDLRSELIQVAAVAVAWVEAIDRES